MENTKNQGLQSGTYQAPKNWEELTADEKIERMREIMKQQSSHISRLQSDSYFFKTNLKQHSHQGDKIVVPFNENSGTGLMGVASLSNEKYF